MENLTEHVQPLTPLSVATASISCVRLCLAATMGSASGDTLM